MTRPPPLLLTRDLSEAVATKAFGLATAERERASPAIEGERRVSRRTARGVVWAVIVYVLLFPLIASASDVIRIGSKKFTEGYLLSEIMTQMIEAKTDLKVERKFGLGGTVVCFEALKNGSIDLYPEYTGTAFGVLLHGQGILDWRGLKQVFRKEFGLVWFEPFGFNNTYAIAVRRDLAEKSQLHRISDLKNLPHLKFGLSHEFLNRSDGWSSLRQVYFLNPQGVRGLDHGLAYESIHAGQIDVMDAYSTDAKIQKFNLVLLEDDRTHFPKYLAAPLIRNDFLLRHPEIREVLNLLSGKISEEEMQRLNAAVELEGKNFSEAAAHFLVEEGLIPKQKTAVSHGVGQLILEHLFLTFVSVGFATIIGVPAGILVSRRRKLAQIVLGVSGVAQTIPGIALLVFMIPLFGIGAVPAIAALFIYGLLPIVRNSCAGIREISPLLLESADGLGLTKWQRLLYVEVPIASRLIMAGIRISAVTNIGTATLAAFIGAGGLGEPIVTGLALNDMRIVFRGAIPAALLAIIVEVFFEMLEKWLTPRGLRVSG